MTDTSSTSPRYRYLSDLGTELRARGLESALLGEANDVVLRVTEPWSRRHAVTVAVPSSQGWFYVWPDGGIWPVEDPSGSADKIVCHLARPNQPTRPGIRYTSKILLGKPTQIERARRIVSAALGSGHPCHDDAVLLASEIATNALRHSASGQLDAQGRPGIFHLTIHNTMAWARIAVRDAGATSIPCACHLRGDDETDGRGITLIESISRSWGFERSAGTNVWFEIGPEL